MNTIFTNLGDISWWFNIFFPVAAVALIPKLIRWVAKFAKSINRRMRLKRLRKIKAIRHNSLAITYEMHKASALFIVFMLAAVGGIVALVTSPLLQQSSRLFPILTSLVAVPVLWAELMWLLKDTFVKDILKARARLRGHRE